MLIKDVIAEILLLETPKKRLTTQYLHVLFFREISEKIGVFDVNNFSNKDYVKFILDLKREKIKRKTFDDYTKFINIIFRYAYQAKYSTHLLSFKKTDAAKEQTGRVYTDVELSKLYFALQTDEHKLQFILSVECFMRLREVLHLRWSKVDLKNKKITLGKDDVKTGSKTGKGRVIPLSKKSIRYMKLIKRESDFVFHNSKNNKFMNSNKKAWQTAKRLAGITGRARWHDLRHTALTKAVMERKVNLSHITFVAGLSIRTLERIYLHPEIEKLREVVGDFKFKKVS